MRLKMQALILAMLLAVILTACGSNTTEEAPANTDAEQATNEGEPAEEGESFPKTITDALDNEVTLEAEPERIVTLIPSITETVYALDQGDKVVGRTDHDNYPAEVEEVESIGGMDFDVEKILSLEPDLVLAHQSGAHNSEEGLNQLRNADIPVIVVHDATEIDAVYRSIALIGEAIGAEAEAEEVVQGMQERFAALEEKASEISEDDRVNVWVEVSPAPSIYTTGQGTFLHEILTLINANNVAGDVEGWVQFSEEEAVALQPDVIVTTYHGYTQDDSAQEINERTAWQDVPAVVNDRIYHVEPDPVARSGPRLAEGAEELAKVIYPEVFAE
nr:ABC transporter substrate-binding protein [Halalkalibacterium ligniniphilum]